MDAEHVDVHDALNGYNTNNECIEEVTVRYLGMVWTARQKSQLGRLV